MDGSAADEDDEYDIFESSMESLFGQHQAASGRPGQKCSLQLEEGVSLQYVIPQHQEASNTRLFAHYQWDAGVNLARMLYQDMKTGKLDITGKSVLELGAGTGLPGLSCAIGGAHQVDITDYPDAGILQAIEENIRMCKVERIARARGLDWSDQNQVNLILQKTTKGRGYDLILCADVLWLSSSHEILLQTIQNLLARSSTSKVVFLSGFHTGRRALRAFFHLAIESGLCSDLDDERGIFEFNVVTGASRPWSGTYPFPEKDLDSCSNDEQNSDNMDDYTERTKWLLYVVFRWAKY